MTFRYIGQSIFTDALSDLEHALSHVPLDSSAIPSIIAQKKQEWTYYEKKAAEYWIKQGIKYAQSQQEKGIEIDISNIHVELSPYLTD